MGTKRAKIRIFTTISLLLALIILAAGCSSAGYGRFQREVAGLDAHYFRAAEKIADARKLFEALTPAEQKKAEKILQELDKKDALFFGLLTAEAGDLSGTKEGLRALEYAEGYYALMPEAARAIAADEKAELSLIASEYFYSYVDTIKDSFDGLIDKAAAFYDARSGDEQFTAFCAGGKETLDQWTAERGLVTAEISEFSSCVAGLKAQLAAGIIEQNYDILYGILLEAREYYEDMSDAAKEKCAQYYEYIFAGAEVSAGADWKIRFEAEKYAIKLIRARAGAGFARLDALISEMEGAGQIVSDTVIFGVTCREWLEETYGLRFAEFVKTIVPVPEHESGLVFAEAILERFAGSPRFVAAAGGYIQMLIDKRAIVDGIIAETVFPSDVEEFRQKIAVVGSAPLSELLEERDRLLLLYSKLSEYSKNIYAGECDYLEESFALIDEEAVRRSQGYLTRLSAADSFEAAEDLEAAHGIDDPIVSEKLFDGRTFSYLVTVKIAELFSALTQDLVPEPGSEPDFGILDGRYKFYSESRADFKVLAQSAKILLEQKRTLLVKYKWEESEFERLHGIFLSEIQKGNDGIEAAVAVEEYYFVMTAFSRGRFLQEYTDLIAYVGQGIEDYYAAIADGFYQSIVFAYDFSMLDTIIYELEFQHERVLAYVIFGDTLYGHIMQKEYELAMPEFFRLRDMIDMVSVHSEMDEGEKQNAADMFSEMLREYNMLDYRVLAADSGGKTLADLIDEKRIELANAGIIV